MPTASSFEGSGLPPHLRVPPQDELAGWAGPGTWVHALRCRRWSKNLLVLTAPAAAGLLGTTFVAGRAALAMVVFCLLSSAIYLLTDVVDLEEDRRHPVKRHRPLAAGLITIPEAMIAAAGCLVVALITAAMVDIRLLLIAVAYSGLNLAYTSWARRVPVFDIAAVAGCVLLRIVAGSAATGISISPDLLAAFTLIALMVGAGQRYAEIRDPAARRARAVLRAYDASLLRRIGLAAGLGAALTYGWWALGAGPGTMPAVRLLSLLPFLGASVRYVKLAGDGAGAAPARLVLEDRVIQLSLALWLLLFLAGA